MTLAWPGLHSLQQVMICEQHLRSSSRALYSNEMINVIRFTCFKSNLPLFLAFIFKCFLKISLRLTWQVNGKKKSREDPQTLDQKSAYLMRRHWRHSFMFPDSLWWNQNDSITTFLKCISRMKSVNNMTWNPNICWTTNSRNWRTKSGLSNLCKQNDTKHRSLHFWL